MTLQVFPSKFSQKYLPKVVNDYFVFEKKTMNKRKSTDTATWAKYCLIALIHYNGHKILLN